MLLTVAGTLLAASAAAQSFTVYVGELGPRHALLAWGRKEAGGNRIGREAQGYGRARLQIGQRSATTDRAWARVEGLEPDTEYKWSLEVAGAAAASGRLRTWAERAERLSFLVIGDYGTGGGAQARLAATMADLVEERSRGADPIRFVLTTGDNIYAPWRGFLPWGSGKDDADWWPRFFEPYRDLLRRIPFYPTLGNHDGNQSEKRGDLAAYLDNFFFPGGEARRWYRFEYGGLAEFFALDTTSNTEQGPPRPAYEASGPQTEWLKRELARPAPPWRIAYFHHSVFNAGPQHYEERNEERLRHWLDLFAGHGVKMAFQGHEHNFQVARVNERSRGIRHFVTGAGGALRQGDVRARMEAANIEAWAPAHHFLLVEIRGAAATLTPVGIGGQPVARPILLP